MKHITKSLLISIISVSLATILAVMTFWNTQVPDWALHAFISIVSVQWFIYLSSCFSKDAEVDTDAE